MEKRLRKRTYEGKNNVDQTTQKEWKNERKNKRTNERTKKHTNHHLYITLLYIFFKCLSCWKAKHNFTGSVTITITLRIYLCHIMTLSGKNGSHYNGISYIVISIVCLLLYARLTISFRFVTVAVSVSVIVVVAVVANFNFRPMLAKSLWACRLWLCICFIFWQSFFFFFFSFDKSWIEPSLLLIVKSPQQNYERFGAQKVFNEISKKKTDSIQPLCRCTSLSVDSFVVHGSY